MDAHVFRKLCLTLEERLLGARIEKIHRPAPDIHLFTLYAQGQKRFLILRSGRRDPLLFFADHKLPAPQEPGAVVMRLRRFCAGRRIKAIRSHWPSRQIAFLMAHEPETWLMLDLRQGPSLASYCAEQEEILWPDMAELRTQFDHIFKQANIAHTEKKDNLEPSSWRDYAVMTPALRRSLVHFAAEDPADAAALMVDIEVGGGDLFMYSGADKPRLLSAWPLPMALRHNTAQAEQEINGLHAKRAPQEIHSNQQAKSLLAEQVYTDDIEATTLFGQGLLSMGLAESAKRVAAKPFSAELGRLQRLLTKLDSEERRLHAMLAQRETAIALQGLLYTIAPDAKYGKIESPTGTIALNPLKTVRENMADMFHQSRRGARGLTMLQERRADVLMQIGLMQSQALEADAVADIRLLQQKKSISSKHKNQTTKNTKNATRKQSLKTTDALAKVVQTFQSTDGIRLYRGRSAEGNAAVLRLAQPNDIWMHTADGPSAHLIIKRHNQEDVPPTTLEEAAILVSLKSWQRHDAQATIMCAYAKDVRPIKGAGVGKVRVEKTFRSITVQIIEDMEERLSLT